MITPEQLTIKLGNFSKCLKSDDTSFLVAPLEFARGEMLFTIHNEATATDGSPIGQPKAAKPPHIGVYGRAHGRRRARRGRQTDRKDLELNSDLRNSVVLGETDGMPSVGFDNSKARLIAEGQQAQTGKRIWGLTDSGRKQFISQLEKALDRNVQDCYDKS